MKYVIIGNGPAGITAAEKLKKLDSKSEVIILSSENYPAYSKCLLPDFLSGEIPDGRMYYRDKDFYNERGIDIQYGQKVTDIDFRSKTLTTQSILDSSPNAVIIPYDKLLIATGSTPILPRVEGIENINYYFLSTFDEAKKIQADSENARKVIIVGGGYVGLEAAFSLYKNGREVTVIERLPRIVQNQLDEKAASIMQNSIEEEGIRLILGASVVKVEKTALSPLTNLFKGNSASIVTLDDGRKLKADMIIMSVGSKPNLDFVTNKALKINRGIVVDRFLETSVKDVFAAGDVVESIDAVTGECRLSPIWPNAVIQGEYAAYNMAGEQKEFPNQLSSQNASEFREIPMVAMGVTESSDPRAEIYMDNRPVDKIYRKLVILDDVIIGMIFLGDIRNSGVINSLIKNRTNVGKIKSNLLNPNFGYSEVATII